MSLRMRIEAVEEWLCNTQAEARAVADAERAVREIASRHGAAAGPLLRIFRRVCPDGYPTVDTLAAFLALEEEAERMAMAAAVQGTTPDK